MHTPNKDRYSAMKYNRCGNSGLMLPAISLGLWHNFGSTSSYDNSREMILGAFDLGITHFDLANNYGPEIGTAEETFGKVLKNDLYGYRDELIISTKAGHRMWEGPYGEWGSKKAMLASLDQSLSRMGLDYVDIFYSHRPDPDTPLEETCEALAQAVKSGKALYAGISKYSPEMTAKAYEILKDMGVRLLIHQPRYSMLAREPEEIGLFDVIADKKIGAIAFSPLAQGLLTNRYLNGIPSDSRAGGASVFLNESNVTPELIEKANKLNIIAKERGQSLAQMALAWVLREDVMTSVIIGASKLSQIEDNVNSLKNAKFTADELARIDGILNGTL